MTFLAIDASNFAAFLVVAVVMMLIPGPDMAFIISRSVAGGRKQGITTALGMQLGFAFHIIVAVCGLAAILMTSTLAFQLVKYIGAAYLIYLGIQTIRDKGQLTFDGLARVETSVWQSFTQGAITNIFNPKNALFFLTFLPQFITAENGHTTLQFICLGVVFGFIGLLFDIGLIFFATFVKDRFSQRPTALMWQKNISGVILIVLGALLALEKQRA